MDIVAAEQPLQSQKRRVKNITSVFGEFLVIKFRSIRTDRPTYRRRGFHL